MAISNGERQRRYRKRAFKDPDGPQRTRLQVLLSPSANDALDGLVKRTGLTKREVVERALLLMVPKVEEEVTEREEAEQKLEMLQQFDVTA